MIELNFFQHLCHCHTSSRKIPDCDWKQKKVVLDFPPHTLIDFCQLDKGATVRRTKSRKLDANRPNMYFVCILNKSPFFLFKERTIHIYVRRIARGLKSLELHVFWRDFNRHSKSLNIPLGEVYQKPKQLAYISKENTKER